MIKPAFSPFQGFTRMPNELVYHEGSINDLSTGHKGQLTFGKRTWQHTFQFIRENLCDDFHQQDVRLIRL